MSWLVDMIDRWVLKQGYKWGKERSKTTLDLFRTLQGKAPNIPVEELYYLTILNTPGFTLRDAKRIIEGPDKETLGASYGPTIALMDNEPLCLRYIVRRMLISESTQYFIRNGVEYPLSYYEACKAIDDIIPVDL